MAATVDHYRIATDAPPKVVARLLGEVWQSTFLRSRLGRVVDVGSRTYRMTFFGNAVIAAIAVEDDVTCLTTAVQSARDPESHLPIVHRFVDVDRLSREVFHDRLVTSLRAAGYRVSVRVDRVPAPPLGA